MVRVAHVNAATYATFVARPGVAVVHFRAESDGSQLAVRRELEAAAGLAGGAVRLAMWNTDDRAALLTVHGLSIRTVPTSLYCRDGTRVGWQSGLVPARAKADVIVRAGAGEWVGSVGPVSR